MAGRFFEVPRWVKDSATGLHGDIDLFMGSYESGSQAALYDWLSESTHKGFESMVQREVNRYSNNLAPTIINEDEL